MPALIDVLRSERSPTVRRGAVAALGDFAAERPEVTEALVVALEDPDVGREAAEALAHRGPATEAAIPRLLLALESQFLPDETRGQVAFTLARLGAREVAPVLLQLLTLPEASLQPSRDGVTRLMTVSRLKVLAVRALGALGDSAAAAVPVLLACLRTNEVELQAEAASALARIGPARDALEPALCDLLVRDENPGWFRELLLETLLATNPQDERALRMLEEAFAPEKVSMPLLLVALQVATPPLRPRVEAWLRRACEKEPALPRWMLGHALNTEPSLLDVAREARRLLGMPAEVTAEEKLEAERKHRQWLGLLPTDGPDKE